MDDFKIQANTSIKLYPASIEKSIFQEMYDFLLFPVRCLFPYKWVQQLHLTDLGRERRRAVLPLLQGKILDIGCGPLAQLKNEYPYPKNIVSSDIIQWGNVDVICSADNVPFPNNTFNTIVMLACLNHITKRDEAIKEAHRVLQENGKIIITMINPIIGFIVHRLCAWFDYDHVRGMHQDEKMGLKNSYIMHLLTHNGFTTIQKNSFLYGLNTVFVAKKK